MGKGRYKLLDFLLPPRCLLCGSSHILAPDIHLCAPCRDDLPLNAHACVQCAIPLEVTASDRGEHRCGSCLISPPDYSRSWSPFIYAQPLEWMIQQLKFNARLHFAPLLSALMQQQLSEGLRNTGAEVMIPLPLHKRRMKQRGFNQSQLLLKPLASALGLPVDNGCCRRIRHTEHQTGKNARQRKQNIRGAFVFDNQRQYRHVILFDDVVTTGSSVGEMCKVLKQGGVEKIDVWSLARAEKKYP